MPVEIMSLPNWFPFHINKISYWSRTVVVPLLIILDKKPKSKNLKNKNFKLVIKGELSLELLHSFVSLDINRDGNSLQLINYEVIEKNLSKNH